MPVGTERIEAITNSIGKSRVLILGDIMLDEYQFGTVDRISPEAPVPVVEIQSTRRLLGGAANVAANIRALGDEPLLMGSVGLDDAARKLTDLLDEKSISSDFIVTDRSRPTTIKTRVIAHSQQVVRVDRETRTNLHPEMEKAFSDRLMRIVSEVDAVIISDYGKGVITKSLLAETVGLCNERGIFVAVDPKETNFPNYRSVSLITPNHHEAGFAYGHKIITEDDLLKVGKGLLEKLDVRSMLITRGGTGMSLFSRDSEPTHIPTFARKVYDVTGAGDTVIATFVSAVCAGADLVEAAVLANAGAGHTVGEIGTATVTVDQLRDELERNIKNGNLIAGSAGNIGVPDLKSL
jgi:D-beta-D-heptose 7-phosphate kinase/D-beta-D-heptose 1-phosphate adenosyltransferase